MLLQEPMQLEAGLEAEQTPQLRFTQHARAKAFQGKAFQDVAGNIVSLLLLHVLHDIIRHLNRHFHRFSPCHRPLSHPSHPRKSLRVRQSVKSCMPKRLPSLTTNN
jgi:hypothetical protein